MLRTGSSLCAILLYHRGKLFSSEVTMRARLWCKRRTGKSKRFTIEKTRTIPLVAAVIVRMLILYRRYDRPLEETVKCQHPKPWTRSTDSAVNNTCTSLFYFSIHQSPASTHANATTTTTTIHCNSPSPIYTS